MADSYFLWMGRSCATMDCSTWKNGTIKKLPDGSVEIENKLPYASDAMFKALVPFVQTKALQAKNLKLHHEWQRRNRV